MKALPPPSLPPAARSDLPSLRHYAQLLFCPPSLSKIISSPLPFTLNEGLEWNSYLLSILQSSRHSIPITVETIYRITGYTQYDL